MLTNDISINGVNSTATMMDFFCLFVLCWFSLYKINILKKDENIDLIIYSWLDIGKSTDASFIEMKRSFDENRFLLKYQSLF